MKFKVGDIITLIGLPKGDSYIITEIQSEWRDHRFDYYTIMSMSNPDEKKNYHMFYLDIIFTIDKEYIRNNALGKLGI